MSDILKNIAKAEVLTLASLVEYSEGQVVSKTLVQNKGVGLTLFAFAKGEGISTHESKGDALAAQRRIHRDARKPSPRCLWQRKLQNAVERHLPGELTSIRCVNKKEG